MNLGEEANRFFYSTHHAVLATQSLRYPGFPFGSVTPFVLDHQGHPIILISTLAEHTKNIHADAKVSLLVFAQAEDLQASARLTVLGEASLTDKDAGLKARYLRYFPQAASYFDMHDFAFYRIEPTHIRYIGGFGKIAWIDKDQFIVPQNSLAEQEPGIVDHMNADHVENLLAYARHFHQVDGREASMLGIDCFGFDVAITLEDGSRNDLRFTFHSPVTNASQAREALVAMAQACRAA
jgi:putative heme iron utilization protein